MGGMAQHEQWVQCIISVWEGEYAFFNVTLTSQILAIELARTVGVKIVTLARSSPKGTALRSDGFLSPPSRVDLVLRK